MKRVIFYISILVIVFFSCEKEPIIDIREGMIFDPDTIMVDSSLYGWELYTWKAGDDWRYSLMPGQFRVRSSAEILSNPYVVNGREQIKLLLRRLPEGEQITWYSDTWVRANVQGVTNMYKMPSLLTQYDIHSFTERNDLVLYIIP